jgi:hypothetical protein
MTTNAEVRPERPGSETLFPPFSIITGGTDSLTYRSDAAYDRLRDHVMHTVFPETIDSTDQITRKRAAQMAGSAIKTFVSLANPSYQQYTWVPKSIKRAARLGIKIVPGKGITLANPSVITESVAPDQVQPANHLQKPAISPTLVAFAQKQTETQKF